MFISKLPKTDSDRRSAIVSYRCVRQVGAGSQTQEPDECHCQPSSKRNQAVNDSGRKIALIILFIKYFPFSNNTVLISFPPGFPNSNQNIS